MSDSLFDYVVVGGGTAGCVVAARLSQDSGVRVLLLEAGGAERSEAIADPVRFGALWGTSVDWRYTTVPQRALGDAVVPVPRGKVLGGSSAINGMVHLRGDPASYDAWEQAGAVGWNYRELLPYLKRSEQAFAGDPGYRGHDGPMRVASPRVTSPLLEACYAAALEAGHPPNADTNGARADGVGWTELNVVDGERQSAADGYLAAAATRSNLVIAPGAQAARLVLDGRRCRGVEYLVRGQHEVAYARRDVILCAGAIGSPQLLMLSGIGPREHLESLGIDVVDELPGVGANLQDHPLAAVVYSASLPVRGSGRARAPRVLLRSAPAAPLDLQIFFMEVPSHPRWTPGSENGYSIVVSLMTPASRGTVRLASRDPRVAPLIDPNYLVEDSDVQRMAAGLRRAREIGKAAALAEFRAGELFPGEQAQSDAALADYLHRATSTYLHHVGTCRIGRGRNAVVDEQLRVHGTEGLRVADASVMPSLPSANPNATVLAIGERAASMLTSTR